jgi:hypothetical protein
MNMKRATRIVVGSAVAGLLAWEGVAIVSGQQGATISEAIWDADATHPYLPYFAGFLCGHLFWQIARSAATGQKAKE